MSAPQIRGYSIRQQATFLRSDHIEEQARKKAIAGLPAELQGDLSHLDPAGWYPRDYSVELFRAIASTAEDEKQARELLSTCGEWIAMESTNTFLKLVMRLMTPVLFAKKLPSLWERDMKGGGFTFDISRANENRLGFVLQDVAGYDHIGPITEGWLRFALKSLGKTDVEVDMEGWSLASPGPKDVGYEVRWA
jgi:hypothetical protein